MPKGKGYKMMGMGKRKMKSMSMSKMASALKKLCKGSAC